MLQTTKRALIVAIATAVVAAPSAASARVYPDRSNGQQLSGAGGGAILSQAGSVQTPGNGFDWGDAGVGAAASALLLGGGGIVVGRRRNTRRAVVG